MTLDRRGDGRWASGPLSVIDAAASARLAVGEAITNIAGAAIATSARSSCPPTGWPRPAIPARTQASSTRSRPWARSWPRLGHRHPGRQGFHVDDDGVARRRKREADESPLSLIVTAFAPVNDVRLALTPTPLQQATSLCSSTWAAARTAWAAPASLRSTGSPATTRRTSTDPRRPAIFLRDSAVTAKASSRLPRSQRRRPLRHAAGDGLRRTNRARDHAAILRHRSSRSTLFREELGAVIQMRRPDRDIVAIFLQRSTSTSAVLGRARTGDEIVIRKDGVLYREHPHRTAQDLVRDQPPHANPPRRPLLCRRGQECRSLDDATRPGLRSLSRSIPPCASCTLRHRAPARRHPARAGCERPGGDGRIVRPRRLCRGRRHHERPVRRQRAPARLHSDSPRAAASLMGTSSVRAADGRAPYSSTKSPRDVPRVLPPRRHLLAGRLQRLPDGGAPHAIVPGAEAGRASCATARSSRRVCALVRRSPSPPPLLRSGWLAPRMPIAVAHGEGRAELAPSQCAELLSAGQVAVRFVDHDGRPTLHYPENPNGSPEGIAALTTLDGRVTIIMPHPERVFRRVQLSWRPPGEGEYSPWMRLFRNARVFVG